MARALKAAELLLAEDTWFLVLQSNSGISWKLPTSGAAGQLLSVGYTSEKANKHKLIYPGLFVIYDSLTHQSFQKATCA